ncbi:MAG TPA: hypothetical protein PJ992_00570 [Arachnia sp.]|nr:hypothetical protein [Arachnia sp.]
MAADDDPVALDAPLDALARDLGHLHRNRQVEALRPGRSDNGLSDRVLRGLVERRGEAQDVLPRHSVMAFDRDDLRAPVGQGAGLVEDERADARRRLERLRPLDQDAEMRRPRQAGHQRHRHGEDQRTGGRHHQHGDGADRVIREPPGGESDRDGHGEKADRPAIGKPRHRRLRALRLLDQADDAGIGAVLCDASRHQVEGLAGVGRAAHGVVSLAQSEGERLARQGRGVEKGGLRRDPAIDGHDVALPDQEPFSGRDVVERHLLERAVPVPGSGAGDARQEVMHLAPRAALGEALEEGAAGIHQGDYGSRQRLAEGERGRHRQRRDDVEPDLAAPQAAQDLDDERRQNRRHARRPGDVGGAGAAKKMQGQA